jgi:hypothetical protein
MRADVLPLQPYESVDQVAVDQPAEPTPEGAAALGGAGGLRVGLDAPC